MAEKLNNLTEKSGSFLFLCLYANFCESGVHSYQLKYVQSAAGWSSSSSKYLQSNFEVPGPLRSLWLFSLYKSDTVLVNKNQMCR